MHLISGRPCSLMAVVCPGCCRVRSSAEAHGIVLSAIALSLGFEAASIEYLGGFIVPIYPY